MHRRGGVHSQVVSDSGWPPHRRDTRRPITRRSRRRGVRWGQVCGRLERSTMPALPCSRYRLAQRRAVVTETPNRSAARAGGQPSSTTHRARRSLPVGVKVALAWDTKTSVVGVVAWSLSHLTRRSSSFHLAMPTGDTTSVVSTSSRLGQCPRCGRKAGRYPLGRQRYARRGDQMLYAWQPGMLASSPGSRVARSDNVVVDPLSDRPLRLPPLQPRARAERTC